MRTESPLVAVPLQVMRAPSKIGVEPDEAASSLSERSVLNQFDGKLQA